jgi:HPt (histidine-containing phosphotransfer) domain-containing protein
MDDYVSKPLDPKALMTVVDRWAQPPEAGQLPALDVAAALPFFDDDQSLFMQLCREFVETLPQRMADLQKALAERKVRDFTRHAHSVKGTAANFGAEPISQICQQLEAMGREQDLSGAPPLLERLAAEYQRLRAAYAEISRQG